jgi:hypothetical protein
MRLRSWVAIRRNSPPRAFGAWELDGLRACGGVAISLVGFWAALQGAVIRTWPGVDSLQWGGSPAVNPTTLRYHVPFRPPLAN